MGNASKSVSIIRMDREGKSVLNCTQFFEFDNKRDSTIVLETEGESVKREHTEPRNIQDIYLDTLRNYFNNPDGSRLYVDVN